jgi:hypothetical protein
MLANYYRVSRLVVLPDYQGIGVGKQGNRLTIILDLVKTITKVKEQLPETQIPQ